jgi:hypothetical protein
MLMSFLERQAEQQDEQLLKLYWNRATVKRELKELRKERYELLDKLKEQEGAILRAQEQLEGLERLLTNPLAAANAMVYFQLRHLWRVAAQRLEQFVVELQAQRERRERAQLHEAALAKRRRRIDAINEKLENLLGKRANVQQEIARLSERLARTNAILRFFRGPRLRARLTGLGAGEAMLAHKIDELRGLMEKIQGEPLPEPQGMSLESRRTINLAVIALAQHLAVHFAEHDLASLAKAAMRRPVADMKFGERRDCDQMVERIRERIEGLRLQKDTADQVRRRVEYLLGTVKYRNDNDSVPLSESFDAIPPMPGRQPAPNRRDSDAPLRMNVLAEEYWDLPSVLR